MLLGRAIGDARLPIETPQRVPISAIIGPMETGSAAANFWRVFGGSLVFYLVGAYVSFNVGSVLVGSLLVATTFCAWASKAPRGAAIGLAVLSTLEAIGTTAVLVHEQAWWRFGYVTSDLVALVLAVRAIEPARVYLVAIRRRESAALDWDRNNRWDSDSDQ